jgi:thiol:disulfide interchange protein
MKKYSVSIVLLLIGVGCGLAYNMIGSEIAADGRLVEPFFLIPFSYFFIVLGLLSFIIIGMIALIKKHKQLK